MGCLLIRDERSGFQDKRYFFENLSEKFKHVFFYTYVLPHVGSER